MELVARDSNSAAFWTVPLVPSASGSDGTSQSDFRLKEILFTLDQNTVGEAMALGGYATQSFHTFF